MKRETLFPSEYAQSLIELAIVLMIAVWLVSGAVEFGTALFQYVQLRDGVQEGAIYGSISPQDDNNIRARVVDVANRPFNLGLTQNDIRIWDDGGRCTGYSLNVEAVYEHQVTMPLISILTGPTIPLRARAVSPILQPACPEEEHDEEHD